MKIRDLKLLLINMVTPVAALCLAYLFWRFPEFLLAVSAAKTVLLGLLSILIFGPLWHGYGRLSAFDKLDALTSLKREHVNNFCTKIRGSILRSFRWSVLILLVVFGMLILVENKAKFDLTALQETALVLVASFIAGVGFVYFIRVAWKTVSLLDTIEVNRIKVMDWQQQESLRKELVEGMRKSQIEQPLNIHNDKHLQKFRELVGNSNLS